MSHNVYVHSKFVDNSSGWGAVITKSNKDIIKQRPIYLYGYNPNITEYRAELNAALIAMQNSPRGKIKLVTESEYVLDGMSKWIYKWIKNDFNNNTVKNRDLWEEIYKLIKKRKIEFCHGKYVSKDPEFRLAKNMAHESTLKRNNTVRRFS
jgi:ribonuclease HI